MCKLSHYCIPTVKPTNNAEHLTHVTIQINIINLDLLQ